MWKVIKDLYTNVKAQVLYAVSLPRGTLNVEVIGMLVGNFFGEP